MIMKFKIEELNGVQIVRLEGKIMGGPEEKALVDLKTTFVGEGKYKVVFDLHKVDWINSTGIGLFIGFLTTLRNQGGDLRLAEVPRAVYSLIDKCRLTTILQSYTSVDEAVRSFH
jgi:anti-sigma B factor antagonist